MNGLTAPGRVATKLTPPGRGVPGRRPPTVYPTATATIATGEATAAGP